MAAYCWVGYLWTDCLYTGISSGPNAPYRVLKAFTFYLVDACISCLVCACIVACDTFISSSFAAAAAVSDEDGDGDDGV